MNGGDRPVDGELDGPDEVGRRRLEYRAHEVLLRQRAVLENLDRSERLCHTLERARQRFGIADVGSEPGCLDAFGCELGRKPVRAFLVARDQAGGEALGSEAARDGRSQTLPGSDDCDRGHEPVTARPAAIGHPLRQQSRATVSS